jgi:hypothetical protein
LREPLFMPPLLLGGVDFCTDAAVESSSATALPVSGRPESEEGTMKRYRAGLFFAFVLSMTFARADTVILRDGASYSGQFTSANGGQVGFTDGQGVEYKFPVSDVQSLVFSRTQDIVTLRSGKVYSGQFNGPEYIGFRDGQTIDYNFPLGDVETIVFTQNNALSPARSGVARVIPRGTEIVVHTDETIDSDNSSPGQVFSASVSEDVPDSAGGIAIPRGTRARLVVRNITGGGLCTVQNCRWICFP